MLCLSFAEMNVDRRGVGRGGCTKCDCEMYELPSSEANECAYCSCAPTFHAKITGPPESEYHFSTRIDIHYECLLCPFACSNEQDFGKHLIRHHKNDPAFAVRCSFCGATYTRYNSFQRHISRKHAVQIDSDMQPIEHTCEQNNDDCTDSVRDMTFEQEVQRKVAGLILKLKGKHNVSQAAIDTVVENVVDLGQCFHNGAKLALLQHQNAYDVNGMSELADLTTSSLFDNLQSQFLQQKYFVEELGMIEPVKVCLGQSEVLVKPGQSKLVLHYGYVVPFIPNLSKLLSCPEVITELQNFTENDVGFSYDVCDGTFVKEHPLYLGDKNFLKFMLFCDDMEITNPIGSHTKVHKITIWYWLLLNISPMYRSRLPVIQLLAVAKSKHIKEFGMDAILADFRAAMSDLATGIALPGVGIKTGALLVVVADTPAANQIGGFKEGVGFASRKCRTCNCSADEMMQFFQECQFRLRSEDEHIERCETLGHLSREARRYWSKEYGINTRSTLMDFPHFSITQCLLHDVMHVLFEGICPLILRHLLKHIICSKKYLSLETLNALVSSFPYSFSWSRMKPMRIEQTVLTDDSKTLKQDSSQIWCLMMHLPVLVGSFIPASDEKWLNFIRLQQIVILCMSHRTSQLTVAQLEHLIAVHNYMFRVLYKDVSYIPKLHYLVHVPSQISKFGPARNMWAMRMEAKNGKFKRRKWNNFKNIPYSLSMFHQQSMCYEQTTGSGDPNPFFLRIPDVICEGQVISLRKYQYASSLFARDALEFHDQNVMLTLPRRISIHGITYTRGSVVYLRRKSELCFPVFASVIDIVVLDTAKFLVLQPLDITMYDSHRNCYLTEPSLSSVACCTVSELWNPRPVVVSGSDIVVTEDYIVEHL